MARFRMTALAFALVLVAAFAVAEAWRPVAPAAPGLLDVELASALRSFDDCGDFLDTVRTEALKQVTPYGLGGIGGMGYDQFSSGVALDMGGGAVRREAAMEAGIADTAAGAGQSSGAAAAPPPAPAKDGVVEVSGTNVQERGVDEPDVIKTDGDVMAAVARGRLQLVDLRDGGRRLAATLPLSNGWGHELLLHDGRLLITGTVEEPLAGGDQPASSKEEALRMEEGDQARSGPGRIAIMPMGTPKLELTLLDVRDPAQPRQLGSVRLDGQLVSSRLVDGMVRVVLRSNPQPAMAHPEPGPATIPAEMRELESQATARNTEIVRTSDAEDWLPAYSVRDAEGATVASEPLVACDDIRHPEQFRGFGLLSVLAVPMTGDNAGALTPTGTASVQGDGDTVYATPDRLYVAMNRWEETGPQPRGQIEPATDPAVGGGDNSVVSDDGTVTSVPPASGSSEPFEPGSTGSAGSGPASRPMPIEGDGGIGDTPPDQPMDQPMPVEPDGGPGGPVEPAPEPGVVDPMPAPAPAPGMPAAPPRTFVDVHEFDTSDPARPVYTASGSVPGHLLNQWSLSAHQGHLRIATTDGQFGFEGEGASESAVYVLRREGTRLVEAGRVSGLGKGERIYAVRYFGDYGFVVTFRQTDPLYTLDLSNPAAPRVAGELKVPGFSAYLHPVGPGLLLGVGQNADEADGRRLGVQVSLFDVSNLAAPARVANLTMEPESSTEVEHEHRAFLWWPAAKRAVLPYMRAHWDEKTQRDAGFFGALALDVDGGVREAGRLTHIAEGNPDPWWAQIRRAVVVGDTLYTMSERGLLASDVDDLSERGFLEFTGPTPQQQQVDPGFGGVEPGVAEPMPERLIVD